jgi:hypothetical protein
VPSPSKVCCSPRRCSASYSRSVQSDGVKSVRVIGVRIDMLATPPNFASNCYRISAPHRMTRGAKKRK